MNAQTEMTDAEIDQVLDAAKVPELGNVPLEYDRQVARAIIAHLTKPDAGGVEAELAEALADVMSWISNWTPDFIYDAAWPDMREKVTLAVSNYEAALNSTAQESAE